jgi:pimeloyl-ACP methyl ester carboxylesterase
VERPESRYVKAVDGVSIGYQVFGEGPYDLVVNDGWMGNLDANWDVDEIARLLRVWAQRARVITFDRRGFGISDRPGTPGQMAIEKSLDDMRAVMDAAASERAVVYGFEAGATVSLLFAASYPERVTALVLHAPLVRYWRAPDFPWGWTLEEASEWDRRIETSWGTPEFWRWNVESLGYELSTDELRDWARWSRLSASPGAALAIERAERETDVRSILAGIQVPTLVMLGENDRDGEHWGAAPWVADQIPGARYHELAGAAHFLQPEGSDAFDAIDHFVNEIRHVEAEFDRYLASVLFTDIVGSTERAASLGDKGWAELVTRHHGVVRTMLARYRGTEIDTAGDGFFAAFDGPARAVRCAQQIAEAVQPLGLKIRAGVHTGEVQTVDGKIAGMTVLIGARVGAKAGASEVLVSQTVKDLVAGSDLSFEDAGEHELKGVPDRWRLYRVVSARE